MDQSLIDEINSQLDYGENRSAWVRDAIRLKLELINNFEEVETMDGEERRQFVLTAVRDSLED